MLIFFGFLASTAQHWFEGAIDKFLNHNENDPPHEARGENSFPAHSLVDIKKCIGPGRRMNDLEERHGSDGARNGDGLPVQYSALDDGISHDAGHDVPAHDGFGLGGWGGGQAK